jgi:hypothetical protein
MFLRKYMEKQFLFSGHKILTEGVFVTQLPSNVVFQFDELCWMPHIAYT